MLDDFGRRLAELRKERRWTQARAAELVGMGWKTYQAIELGRLPITLRTAVDIANGFDVPLRILFDPPTSRVERRPGRPPKVAGHPSARRRVARRTG